MSLAENQLEFSLLQYGAESMKAHSPPRNWGQTGPSTNLCSTSIAMRARHRQDGRTDERTWRTHDPACPFHFLLPLPLLTHTHVLCTLQIVAARTHLFVPASRQAGRQAAPGERTSAAA